ASSRASLAVDGQGTFAIADFEREGVAVSAHPWPTDKDGQRTTARVSAARTTDGGRSALRVDYEFPSEKCTQVMVDVPVRAARCFGQLQFALRGDGSGNGLHVWLSGAGRWFGQGKVALDFDGWRDIALPVQQVDTDVVTKLRLSLVQAGGLGKRTLFFDDIRLVEPTTPKISDLRVFPEPPSALLDAAPAAKPFRIERRKVDDRTVLLLDGEPLFCVLDVRLEREYLEAARAAGVNCFAIDLYWQAVEPRQGYREWPRLRQTLDCLQRWGFGVILMLGAHQPTWWTARHADEPGADTGQAYPFSPVLQRDLGGYVAEFVRQTCDFPNVIAYMVSAGGEQDTSFHEVLGDPKGESAWRKSPSCLRDFRDFLRTKHGGDVAKLRAAWHDNGVTFENAAPPSRLPEDDYRRAWLDWCEFANAWWVRFADWAGGIVKGIAPSKLFQVRFGWPVFQAENIFLARQCRFVDLAQCKDAVASWEVGHPGYQLHRTALYLGACKHSDKIVFPEMDIIH
ncbi:MAG: hypothetical protein FJ272_23110, partial [Planctomycetes bacterium]|nr:hypothetical protein [Planctomycetota bacterium]